MAKKSSSPTKKVTAKKAKGTTNKKAKSGGGTASDRIMEAIASQRIFGIENADRQTVQGLAAIPNKKCFDTTLLNMRKKGLLTYDTNTVTFTEAGLEQVGPDAVARPATNDAMQDKLKESLKHKKSRDIFDILTDGRAYSREELAEKLGLELNKSFGTYLSGLSKVSERVEGKIRLKDTAFPVGRPCDA